MEKGDDKVCDACFSSWRFRLEEKQVCWVNETNARERANILRDRLNNRIRLYVKYTVKKLGA